MNYMKSRLQSIENLLWRCSIHWIGVSEGKKERIFDELNGCKFSTTVKRCNLLYPRSPINSKRYKIILIPRHIIDKFHITENKNKKKQMKRMKHKIWKQPTRKDRSHIKIALRLRADFSTTVKAEHSRIVHYID